MATSKKSKKPTKKLKPTARKQTKRTPGKASAPAGTKPAKIKLNVSGGLANRAMEALSNSVIANKDLLVEISSDLLS